MKTYSTKASDIQRQWHVIDASSEVLGRMAARAARLLMGKHKVMYARHLDTGDYVIIINAAQVKTTGNKGQGKIYYRHTGYPGGIKAVTLERMMATHPERVIEKAIKGMLPKNALGRAMARKLKVYAGESHPHGGQVGAGVGKGQPEEGKGQ
ncbi:MAG: 50S ribosomal protein L13 [Dehalococcoidia bacterium]